MYLNPVQFQGDMKNHERLHMFARDIIRVRNPLSEDFTFIYDSIPNTVAAGQTKDMERYLADKFLWDISQHIISQIIENQGTTAIENYKKMNPMLLLDKYVENKMIWEKIPRMDDPKLQTAVAKNVIVGLITKYGEVRLPPKQTAKIDPNTPLYKDLMNQLTAVPLDELPVAEREERERIIPTGTPVDGISERSMADAITIA